MALKLSKLLGRLNVCNVNQYTTYEDVRYSYLSYLALLILNIPQKPYLVYLSEVALVYHKQTSRQQANASCSSLSTLSLIMEFCQCIWFTK